MMSATTTEVPVTETPEQTTTVRPGDDDQLAAATSRLRSRTSIPVDKWFQLVGAILMGVGLLAIIGGWYGVSHTAREWRQTPYILSGGILGLGLIFIGGFSYFAFWLTKLVEQTHRQTAVLERIEHAMRGEGAADDDAVTVVVDPTETAHRNDCPLVMGKSDLRPYAPGEHGLTACPMCEPALPEAAPPAEVASASRRRGRLSAKG